MIMTVEYRRCQASPSHERPRSMPVTQADYTRALARAHAEHITIIGIEVTPSATTYAVRNPQRAGGHYTVTRPTGAPAMSCNCAAGERGGHLEHPPVGAAPTPATDA